MNDLQEVLRAKLAGMAQEAVFERQEFLVREGAVERHAYWILEGAVRAFYLTEHEEHAIRFGYEGSVITSLASFLTGKPSEYYLQALRRTRVLAIPKEAFMAVLRDDPDFQMLYIQLLEGLVVQQMEREIDLLTPSPAERLRRVQARSPQVFQEIPAKYIASYLRMSPETLSRMRKS